MGAQSARCQSSTLRGAAHGARRRQRPHLREGKKARRRLLVRPRVELWRERHAQLVERRRRQRRQRGVGVGVAHVQPRVAGAADAQVRRAIGVRQRARVAARHAHGAVVATAGRPDGHAAPQRRHERRGRRRGVRPLALQRRREARAPQPAPGAVVAVVEGRGRQRGARRGVREGGVGEHVLKRVERGRVQRARLRQLKHAPLRRVCEHRARQQRTSKARGDAPGGSDAHLLPLPLQ